MIYLIWVVVLVVAIAAYLRDVYSKLDKFGIRHLKPIPILGNMLPILTKKTHMAQNMERNYFAHPDDRFTGSYSFLTPTLMIHDLELIRNIGIKDFEYFLDRRRIVDETIEPFFGRNLFSMRAVQRALVKIGLFYKFQTGGGKFSQPYIDRENFFVMRYHCPNLVAKISQKLLYTCRNSLDVAYSQGQEWKDMRSTLSPAFTSSKMRGMVPFMVEVNEQMIRVLKNKIKNSKDGNIDVDCKDLTTRYANDVIASCAFGVKLDSHTEETNEFYLNGKGIATFGFRAILVVLGYNAIPFLLKLLRVRLFSEETTTFFKRLVMNNMKEREEHKILRPDMIHLLMEAKKGKLHHDRAEKNQTAGFATVEESELGTKTVSRDWSDNDLIAQAVVFFVAGFETVSSTMSFLLYELALNPDVQDKLVAEIKENDAKNGGKFDYNSIQNLKYLDMVISEVLRLWPPVIGLTRECKKDYNMGRANDKAPRDYIIRKGETVTIPIFPMHRDPRYFPNPTKFDPERFSDENKGNIKPFSYMPFGVGPRNCIGSRFALCEVNVMAYQMIQNIEMAPCERTAIPPKLDPSTFNTILKGGCWLQMKARQ